MKKYQVDSIQVWDDFEHAGTRYAMGHLSCHAVMFKGEKLSPEFLVTYGLHCFTDDNSEYAIAFAYPDGRHERRVCLERYEASKKLRGLLEKLDQGAVIHQTRDERFFTMKMLNSATGKLELYKICLAFFHEHRLLRMHVTSAFSPVGVKASTSQSTGRVSISSRSQCRPEANLRGCVPKRSEIDTRNDQARNSDPLSRRGSQLPNSVRCGRAGRCRLVMDELLFSSSGVRSEDPCNHPERDQVAK